MPEASLLAEVMDVVRKSGKVQPGIAIEPQCRLVEDLGIDSLDLVGVFLEIQDRYNVVIEDDDVPRLLRVSDLAAYVADSRSIAA